MQTIHIDTILVPENRQRRDFDEKALDELAKSIREKGLLHPVVLHNDGRTLVAGERRLRAVARLYSAGHLLLGPDGAIEVGHVPYTRLGDLDPLAVREAELEENVIRRDLTWQEHSAAIAELHDLRSAQKVAAGAKPQTVRDTASEIIGKLASGTDHQRVAKALRIAEHLDDPEVASAKTEKDALKVIERKAKAQHRERLLAEFGAIASMHTFHQGDALDILPMLASESFDIILTDPPYGIDAETFGGQARARHEYLDNVESALGCYSKLFHEANRLCKANAFLFAFCDIRIYPTLQTIFQQLCPTWTPWATPLIWSKNGGMLPVPDKGPRRTYEAIFYAYRGNRTWNTQGTSDVIEIPGLSALEFGAQKPPELYQYLLERVAQPGDCVLDAFAGTCPVVPAAEALSLVATCIELSQEKLNFAKTEYLNA